MTGDGILKTGTDTITVHTASDHHGGGADITARTGVHITVRTGVHGVTVRGDITDFMTHGTTTRGDMPDTGDGMTHGITTIITDGITRPTTALHTSPGRRMAETDITVCAHIPKNPLPAQDARSHRQAVQSEAPAEPHEEA